MLTVDFDYHISGLKVNFTNTSSGSIGGYSPLWDFGDGIISQLENPVHEYAETGRYRVKLSYVNSSNVIVATNYSEIIVSDKVKTTLSDTIYNLIDIYLPEEIVGAVSNKVKKTFIEKWQLYLQPIVNHTIPLEYWNNEGYYEGLENQLIMELAAYDYLFVFVSNMYKAAAKQVTGSTVSSSSTVPGEKAEGDIKHITTGPTEVEYFDTNSHNADYASIINKVLQPGGLIDNLKATICMLASRLEIYLPICDNASIIVKPPRVVNRRRPGPLGGPDPSLPIRK